MQDAAQPQSATSSSPAAHPAAAAAAPPAGLQAASGSAARKRQAGSISPSSSSDDALQHSPVLLKLHESFNAALSEWRQLSLASPQLDPLSFLTDERKAQMLRVVTQVVAHGQLGSSELVRLADLFLLSQEAQRDTCVKSLSQAFQAAALKATSDVKRLYMEQANTRLRLHKLLEFKNGPNEKLPKSLLPRSQLLASPPSGGARTAPSSDLEFRYKQAREQLDHTIKSINDKLVELETKICQTPDGLPAAILDLALWHRLRALHIQNCHNRTQPQLLFLQVRELSIKYLGAIAYAHKLLSSHAAAATEMLASKLRSFEDKTARNKDLQAAVDMTSTEELIKAEVSRAVQKALAAANSSKNEQRRGRQQSRPAQAINSGNKNQQRRTTNNNGRQPRRRNNNSSSRPPPRSTSASATSPRRSNGNTSQGRSNRRPPSAPHFASRRRRSNTPSRRAPAANALHRSSAAANSNTSGRGSRTSSPRRGSSGNALRAQTESRPQRRGRGRD